MEKPIWLNNEVFSDEEQTKYYEQEIELAREGGALSERHRMLKKLSDTGVGYYIGEGIFKITIEGVSIEIDIID